jgi:hypothetical protein
MQYFDPWHTDRIAQTLKVLKNEVSADVYQVVVEEFIDMLQTENPHWKANNFRKKCGVPNPFSLKAKVPIKRTRKGVSKYD